MKIFREKPRTYKETSKILGVQENTVMQALHRINKGKATKTHGIDYKVACNCTDEFLELLMNDENFKGFKLKNLDKLQ